MSVDLAAFKAWGPEFVVTGPSATAHDAMLQTRLDEAANELDATLWGKWYDTGVKYLAANKLCLTPFGNNARVKERTTLYADEYKRLQTVVASGRDRVTGYSEADLALIGG